jgi:hypothetical protein
MLTIQHKIYGEGKVINKEVKENDIILTAQFGDGSERRFAAESFRMGAVKADGALKAEIDAVIAAKQAAEEARKNAVRVASVASPKPVRVKASGKDKKRWIPSSLLAVAYEKYLIDNGYKLESDVGNPSTVYSYGNAVEKIISREGLTWDDLANNIDDVVTKYDKGGVHESFGEKSNKTYINALKRFQESLSLK